MQTQKLKIFSINGWRALCVPNTQNAKQTAAQLLALDTTQPQRVIRDNQRSLLKLYEWNNIFVVSKTPREKDRRKWIRLTTWWRCAEAFSTVKKMQFLSNAGIAVPRPIMAFEKRHFGMVVESRIFYEYTKATACTKANWPDIIKAISAIHATKRVHGDTNIENFVLSSSGVVVLDCRTKPALFGAVSRKYDFVLLVRSCPAIKAFLPFSTTNPAFVTAQAFNAFIRLWRKLKRTLRRLKKS